MEVSGHLHARAALPPEKNTVTVEYAAGWAAEHIWTFCGSETCPALDGIETPDRSAHSIFRSVDRSLNSCSDGGESSKFVIVQVLKKFRLS
jgi:hypothetical protein